VALAQSISVAILAEVHDDLMRILSGRVLWYAPHVTSLGEHKPCLLDVMRSSHGQERGDPVVVFGPGRGMEGRDLARKRRNCGPCAALRRRLSGNSRSILPC
jgi:hypothetical protein